MEQLGDKKWGFQRNQELEASSISVRGVLKQLMANRNDEDQRSTIPLGGADPSMYPSYRTTPFVADAVADAVRSFNFNSYASNAGIPEGRRYVSKPSTFIYIYIYIYIKVEKANGNKL